MKVDKKKKNKSKIIKIKKRNFNLLFLILVIGFISGFFVLVIGSYKARATFASGSGTEVDPYQISSCEQLQLTGAVENLAANFVLVNDIDCSDTINWNGTEGFVPIGDNTNNFNGKFNGAGFEVRNLYINLPENDYVGLFGYIGATAQISNIGIKDSEITGYNYVGGLVGYSTAGSVIEKTYAIVDLTLVRNSSAAYVGGLVGYLRGTVNNSYARGFIDSPASSYAGGLIGYNNCTYSSVNNSYAASYIVSSALNARGFIGSVTNGSTCIAGSFWDKNVSSKVSASGATSKFTNELKTLSTFTDAGWDMSGIWAIDEDKNNGYPYLIDNDPGIDTIIEIATIDDLQAIDDNPGGRFIQTADIDASATATWNEGAGFLPIAHFYGEYNGNGFKVSNFTINRPTTDYVGVFSQNRGLVAGLKLVDSSIIGQSYTGAITGYNWGSISKSSSDRINGSSNQTTGYNYVGGLIGYNDEIANVSQSYAVSNVTITYSSASAWAGGLIGYNYGQVDDCYARGELTSPASTKVGGLFGYVYGTTSRITNSFAAVVMGSSASAYGFTGTVGNISVDTFTGCFYNKNVSAKSSAGGSYITGKLDSELQTASTFTDAGWDMSGKWAIDENKNNGYPYLINNETGIDPIIEIATIDDLQAIADNPGGRFIQTADIDASATATWNDGAGFLPIPIFYGRYDDNGYTTTNLTINRPTEDYVGVFGQNRGEIRNFKLADSSVTGRNYTGSVIGYNWGTVYRTKSFRLNDSSNQTNGYNYVGGLIGYNDEIANVSQSYAVSNVTITYSSATAYAGGLIGYNYGQVDDCYARGALTSPALTKAGGLFGYVYGTTSRITNSFAAVVMGSSASAYGFTGSVGNINVNTFIGCFWDKTVSGKTTAGGSYITGKTTEELKTLSTFTDAGWDFEGDVWHKDPDMIKNDGYPYLNPPVLPTIEIDSVEDLQNISNSPSSNYILTADIDASASATWNDGAGFLPIPIFYGQLNGNGYKITNLTINRPTSDYVGIFGQNRGSISNLYLADSSITGQTYVGSLVGYNWGTIYRSKSFRLNDSSNEVIGLSNVGGLVGYNNNVGTISQSYAVVNVEVVGTFSTAYGGGLVGYNLGTVNNCFARGALTSSGSRVGGLFGYVYGTTGRVTNSFAAVDMDDSSATYGFVGVVGNVSAETFVGCFWDKTVSGKNNAGGSYVVGKTTSELKTLTTYTAASWDFDLVWGLDGFNNDGYAHLLFDAEEYEDPNFTLIVNRDGQGSVTVDGEIYNSPISFASGTSALLQASPDSGWLFQKWEDDSVNSSRTVVMSEDKTLTAYFVEDSTPTVDYTLEVTEFDHGSITVNGEVYVAPRTFSSGSTVFLAAISDPGWRFREWENENTNSNREVLMDGNKSLAAYFYEISYIVPGPGPTPDDIEIPIDDPNEDLTEEGEGDDEQESEDQPEQAVSLVREVLAFNVYDIGNSNLWLVWQIPVFENFSKVEIYRSEEQMPVKYNDGTLVYQGVDQEYIDKEISSDKNYFYSISVIDKNGLVSKPTIYHYILETDSVSDEEKKKDESIALDIDDSEPPTPTQNPKENQTPTNQVIEIALSDDVTQNLPIQAPDSQIEQEVLETNKPKIETETVVPEVIGLIEGQNKEKNIIEVLKPLVLGIANNPELKAVNKVVAPTLILTAMANALSAFSFFNLFAYLRYLFTQPASVIYRYKRRKWGVVYNSLTKQPIDLAIVRLYRKSDNRLIQSAVTDKFGRYHLLTEPGEYYLTVVKPNFNFPTNFLKDQTQDISYLDLYDGRNILIQDNQTAINQNIPIDPQEKILPTRKIIILNYLRKIQKAFAFSAVVLALISFAIDPGKTTAIFFATHLALFGLFYRLGYQKMPKSWGRVYDLLSKKPLNNAIVRIYDKKYNKLLETRVANKSGNYAFLVNNNLFYLTAEKPGFNQYKSQDIDLIGKKDQSMVTMDIGLAKG